MNDFYKPFEKQKYLNIETFRRSGIGVKTPVWFVQEGETLFIRTIGNSGKVKRVRNNPQVNIVPCKMDGTPLCAWVPAIAREVKDEETDRKVNKLLDKKYGLLKKMFTMAGRNGQKYTILEVKGGE